jgi:ribosomal protein S18 acetylase RimI-like enzyme
MPERTIPFVTTVSAPAIRTEFRDEDAAAIVELHRRVYLAEYARNEAFIAAVKESVESAVANGWPHRGAGRAWLIDGPEGLAGSMALTDEGGGMGHIRWVVFGPELRGQGLARRMFDELLAHVRACGFLRLELETYSELTAAAHMYRSAGFIVTWERPRDDWGPQIVYQHYELAQL